MFLWRILDHPEEFLHEIQRTAAGITISILYGEEEGAMRDSIIAAAEEATESLVEAGNLGDHAVDILPILKHVPEWILPGGGFKRKARELRTICHRMLDLPFEHVKQQMKDGIAKPCVTAHMLEQLQAGDPALDEYLIKTTAGVIWVGGADTQLASLYSFMLAMALNPNVQKAAQQEIDHAIGEDRLPAFSDRHALPYMECIIQEIHRWNPVVPLGVPHTVMQDDNYKSHKIPAGTIIMPNIWGILHDAEVYANPYEFRPERYLGQDEKSKPAADPRTWSFGFGRRHCPGRHFADITLWFMFTSILAAFDIGEPFDDTGKRISYHAPPGPYTSGLVSRPKPFKCSITPRPGRTELIRRQVQAP